MPIVVRLDVMLAQRKMRSKELAEVTTEPSIRVVPPGRVSSTTTNSRSQAGRSG